MNFTEQHTTSKERATLSSYAKAVSAGSSMRRAKRLGRIFRGAFVTRGAFAGVKGSGAPSHRSHAQMTALAGAFAFLFFVAIFSPTATAAPPVLWQTKAPPEIPACGAGHVGQARGGATAPVGASNAGHVFVGDQSCRRVAEFTAWGVFVKAWGWDVAPDGAPGDTLADEFEICTIVCQTGTRGTAGTGQFDTPVSIAVDASGDIYVFQPGTGARVQKFNPAGEFIRTWGWNVVSAGPGQSDEIQTLTVSATAGQFTLTFGANTTADIPFDASAAAVAAELNGLASINTGGGSVSVSGGPGDATGSSPYLISFDGGPLAGTDVAQLSAADGTLPLSGGNPASDAIVATINPGATGFEICVPADGDTCQAGIPGTGRGQFPASGATGIQGLSTVMDITPDDKVFVGDNGRIQRFNTAGEFQATVPLTGETVQHLAVDAAGNFYLAYRLTPNAGSNVSKPNVVKLSPAGTPLPPVFEVSNPRGLDVASDGHVYAFEQSSAATAEGGSAQGRIRHFDPSGNQVETVPSAGESADLNNLSTGLSVNNCGTAQNSVYHSNNSAPSFLRAYSEPPDPDLCGEPEEVPPVITDAHAISVGAGDAVVRARVNPRFWEDTAYAVQYATAACIEAEGWEAACVQERPASPLQLGAGVTSADILTKGVALTGLSPNTAYRYRFVAESSGGGPVYGEGPASSAPGDAAWEACIADPECGSFRTLRTFPLPAAPNTDCSNRQFRVGPSANLPDCRAYEMVSPLDKDNGDVNIAAKNGPHEPAAVSRSAADGTGLSYVSYRAFAEPEGAPYVSQYIARRSSELGWSSESIVAPGTSYYPNGGGLALGDSPFKTFTEDLCHGWTFFDSLPALTPDALQGKTNYYRRDNCDPGKGLFEPLITEAETQHMNTGPDALAADRFWPELQGVSENGHSIFRIAEPLTANTSGISIQLYERHPGGLRAVCVLPGQTTAIAQDCSAGTANEGEIRGSVPQGEAPFGMRRQSVDNAISNNGSRIIWSAGAGLFVRLDGEQTIQISSSSNVRFQTAATDGSAVIFSVGGELSSFNVDEAISLAGEGKSGAEIMAGAKTQIAPGGLVENILGASEDATRVYFASTQVFTTEPNSEDATAQGGQPNIYYHEVGSGEYRFVGSLRPGGPSVGGDVISVLRLYSPVNNRPAYRTSQVSADGSALVFNSTAALTGADNRDRAGQAIRPLAEVFVYDAQSDTLACASCHRGGVRPVGRDLSINQSSNITNWMAAVVPHPQSQTYNRRPLSDDGRRLFFDSFNPLTLADTNGRRDVYEFRWANGGCEADGSVMLESEGGDPWGCLGLISSGKSPADSEFMDADRSGDNVFFATEGSLVPQDYGLRDAYVARVGGGLPPPAKPVECEGEACQGAATAPSFDSPSSASFAGPGDPVAQPNCGGLTRQASRLANRARRARRAARLVKTPAKAQRMRRAARRNVRRARDLGKRAKRCRAAQRRAANTSGGAGR